MIVGLIEGSLFDCPSGEFVESQIDTEIGVVILNGSRSI